MGLEFEHWISSASGLVTMFRSIKRRSENMVGKIGLKYTTNPDFIAHKIWSLVSMLNNNNNIYLGLYSTIVINLVYRCKVNISRLLIPIWIAPTNFNSLDYT